MSFGKGLHPSFQHERALPQAGAAKEVTTWAFRPLEKADAGAFADGGLAWHLPTAAVSDSGLRVATTGFLGA